MNLKEYEDKLRSLNPDELQKFNSDFGGGDKSVSYCQELCMASGGDPFFNNAINKFYSPDYFSKSLGVM